MILLLLPALLAHFAEATFSNRSFVIDYSRDQFLKDGYPYRYISGSIHYFRVPHSYWDDRLSKMKAGGLNAIEFYIPWSMHEPLPGEFDFSSDLNVLEFLRLAQKNGLDVILRMGPYVCGEIDNGGLPWWLMKLEPNMRQRTSDTLYLYYVTRWYFKVFPMIIPYLYKNGGPIIMVQVENEYGSFYACDQRYMIYLRDLFRSYVGNDVVLFTTDGGTTGYLKCGFTPGLYPTVDFGTGTRASISVGFAAQRVYAPRGPLVNSEFYPGWLDTWGLNHSTIPTKDVTDSMSSMYDFGASFNFYMYYGGTTFGYWAGSVGTRPCVTSYDYDAPLDEAGNPTDKYMQIRRTIENLTGTPNPYPMPRSSPARDYGVIETTLIGSVLDLLHLWGDKKVTSNFPLTFEQIGVGYGFLLYETIIPLDTTGQSDGNLSMPGIRDRGYVMIGGQVQGIVSNLDRIYEVRIQAKRGQKLQILVENSGRHTQGPPGQKGLLSNVTLGGYNVLSNWTMYPIVVEDLFPPLKWDKPQRTVKNLVKSSPNLGSARPNEGFTPSIYYAKFSLDQQVEDTYFHPGNWSKGQLFINDFNVGRYWPSLGPQVTLYVPKTILKSQLNYALLLELEKPGNCVDSSLSKCSFRFTDIPFLNKTVYAKTDTDTKGSDWKTYREITQKEN